MESEVLKRHLLKFRPGEATEKLKNKNISAITTPLSLECENHENDNPVLRDQITPERWDDQINELENFFAGITLPTQPIKLDKCSTITNIPVFLESHFAVVKSNNGNHTFIGYLNRLKKLKQILC